MFFLYFDCSCVLLKIFGVINLVRWEGGMYFLVFDYIMFFYLFNDISNRGESFFCSGVR